MSILKDFQRHPSTDRLRDLGELRRLLEQYLVRDGDPRRRELHEQYQAGAGAALTGRTGLRRRLGALDLEFFGRAYFLHYFIKPGAGFHRELDKLWQDRVLKGQVPDDPETVRRISLMDGSRCATAAPRGHAKSTSFTFKDTLHAILYGYKHYIILLSDSSEQAEGFLAAIRIELEENEAIREDFGDLQGRVWRDDVLITSTDIRVDAIGSGKKIRGRKHRNWRPDLIILDDVENDENVATADQRKKMKNWFTKAVSKAGDNYTDIMVIGTILHWDSLLNNILKNPGYLSRIYKAVISWATRKDLWEQWEQIFTNLENERRQEDAREFFEQHREEMLEGTKVLWEESKPYYDLMVARVTDGEASFNSELQNEPINPEDMIFLEEWIDWYNPFEIDFRKDFEFYGFCDPSLGKKARSDTSAIITLAKHTRTGYLYVLDADIERRHPDRIILDILAKEKWLRETFGRGYYKFGFETNQFQWYVKETLARESAAANLYLPIVEVHQHEDKVGRIQTLQPDIKNKYIKFNRQHKRLLEQLLNYTAKTTSHDDGPDALEGARTLAKGPAVDNSLLMSVFRGLKVWR